MYSNSSYNYNQAHKAVNTQPQYIQSPEMDTTYGYTMAPPSIPMQQPIQQMGGQMGAQMGAQIQAPVTGAAPVDFDTLPTTPVFDLGYTQGYLKSQIGARVKVEFLIGTNMLIDREGTLTDVGISYIIINEVETDDLLLCDIYSIKFVRFYY